MGKRRNLILSIGKNVWIIYYYHILLVGISAGVTSLESNLLTVVNFVNAHIILMPAMYLMNTPVHTHTNICTHAYTYT